MTVPMMVPIQQMKSLQRMVAYAHMAYEEPHSFQGIFPDLEGLSQYRFLHILNRFISDTFVHLGLRPGSREDSDTLILSFRGTDFPRTYLNILNIYRLNAFRTNFWTDLSYGMTEPTWLQGKKILIHEGILTAFNSVREKLKISIDQLLKNSGHEVKTIEICGHSLGGALASIAVLQCRLWFPNKEISIKCVTIGSPRVGNKNFVDEFTKSVTKSWRIVNGSDPVPNVPNRRTSFLAIHGGTHVPPETPKKYLHVGNPIWIHKNGNMVQSEPRNRPDIELEELAPIKISLIQKGILLAFGWIYIITFLHHLFFYHDDLFYVEIIADYVN